MTLTRYPSYRDSESGWMGEIPASWREEPIKYAVSLVNGAVFKPDSWSDTGVPIVRIENLNGGDAFNFCDHFVESRHHLHKGDLVFAWSGNRGTSFGPFIWNRDGLHYLNQHIFKIVDHCFDKKWLYWTLKALTHHVEEKAHGIIGMVHITKGELGDISIPKIQREEQSCIASFLDRETAKIDTLIAKQERLIKLLEEKRQAVISHAVTKGLNPDVRMKESGVEWLGEIPEHWDIKQLRHIARTAGGGTPSKDRSDFWGGDIPWISPKDMKRDFLDSSEDTITTAAVANSAVKLLPPGSLLIVVRGMILVHSVPVGIATRAFTINQDMKAFMPACATTSDYLLLLLKGLKLRLLELVGDSAHGTKKLDTDALQRLLLPMPPEVEQEEIVRRVRERMQQFDQLKSAANAASTLLKERRTALISAAVTGKIDVRNAV